MKVFVLIFVNEQTGSLGECKVFKSKKLAMEYLHSIRSTRFNAGLKVKLLERPIITAVL